MALKRYSKCKDYYYYKYNFQNNKTNEADYHNANDQIIIIIYIIIISTKKKNGYGKISDRERSAAGQ